MTSNLPKCPKCGAGNPSYKEISGEYVNKITCSNVACQFESCGDWIEDPRVFQRWTDGEGATLKDDLIEFYGPDVAKKLFGLKYWR